MTDRPRERLRVAVLMGGPSAEREVSLDSGRKIAEGLAEAGHEVLPVEITAAGQWVLPSAPSPPGLPDGATPAPEADREGSVPLVQAEAEIAAALEETAVDVAFIAMHGAYGEDGTIQGLLEFLNVPYTGSGVLASALGMDKYRCNALLEAHGIPVPPHCLLPRDQGEDPERVGARVAETCGFPCVVKPNGQGSSVGITIVRDPAALPDALALAARYDEAILVEEYIAGPELTCGLLEDPEGGPPQALPVTQILPREEFFTYQCKYTPGMAEEITPAPIDPALTRRVQETAGAVFQTLGCEGFARVDFLCRGEELYVLEVNTIPGMTELSLLPQAAQAAGIPFPALLDRLVRLARRRHQRRTVRRTLRPGGAPPAG